MDDAKRAMRESIVYPTKRRDLFLLGWPRGILLYGPPGCGKTLLAAAAAAEINGYFINVDAASTMSKRLGEAEKNVSKLFRLARKLHDSEAVSTLLFIDEIDSLLGLRNSEVGGEVRVRNQFLTEMDGINDKFKNSKLFVIGATNKPWVLEAGFLSRFQKRIYVSLPDQSSRSNLFRQYTERLKMENSLKPEDLASITEGYSASDVKDICQSAQLRVMYRVRNEVVLNSPQKVTEEILQQYYEAFDAQIDRPSSLLSKVRKIENTITSQPEEDQVLSLILLSSFKNSVNTIAVVELENPKSTPTE